MNVLVVGSGAVGSLLAFTLAAAGQRVWLTRRTRLPGSGDEPITVIGPDGVRREAIVTAVDSPARLTVAPDLVILAVKAYDVEAALAGLPEWPGSAVLTVQNGTGAEELALAARPTGPLLAGSLTASVDRVADGAVRWLRRGGIGVATVHGATERLVDELREAWARAGLPVHRYGDWAAMKWSKLVANLVANATSALLDVDPAAVYADPDLYEVERAQLREALAVIRALGLRPLALPGANVPALAVAAALPSWLGRPVLRRVVGGARGGKSPSLRLGLAGAAGRSEAPWLNGAVAREAARLGVAAPTNEALARLVVTAATDPVLREHLRGRPDRLVEALAPPAPAAMIGDEAGASTRR